MPLDGQVEQFTKPNQLADDLRAARDFIANGWCQNALEDSFGAVCFAGAIFKATSGDANSVTMRGCRVGAFAARAGGLRHLGEAVDWNNETGRTQAEVLALFDRAIAEAENV